MLDIKIKMIDKNLTRLGGDIEGEWYDLRASSIKKVNGEDVENILEEGLFYYKKGDVLLFGLGIATELPEGYEAIINPRSGTHKNYKFLLTNSQGIVDNTFRGEWLAMVYCTDNGKIEYNDRFLQFRIQKQQPKANIIFTDDLSTTARGEGGYSSTGTK